MHDFDADLDPPLHVSPELVLVSPPDVARAAREALEPRSLEEAATLLGAATPPSPAPEAPAARPLAAPAPARPRVPPARRKPRPVLLSAAALVLVAGGFYAGRELSGDGRQSSPGAAPTAIAPASSAPASPRAGTSTRTLRKRAALPVVSWKPRSGIRRYRFDLVTGRVAILTIITDEPRVRLPLSWPNAGRRRHLVPGRYTWTVRAAAGRSRVIARGAVTIPRPGRS